METKPLVNKVAAKALITINLEDYFPKDADILHIDLKEYLFMGLILKEKDFREHMDNLNTESFAGRYVNIHCSANAVIPMWAYMVLTAKLTGVATDISCTNPAHAAEVFLYRNLSKINLEPFQNARIVIKGCGERAIPEAAFVQITHHLSRVARSVMYGEPCSTVPVYKKSID